jgi:hypothetical protein
MLRRCPSSIKTGPSHSQIQNTVCQRFAARLATRPDDAVLMRRVYRRTVTASSLSKTPLPHGRSDELQHGSPGIDPRCVPKGPKPRDIYDPYGHIDQIKVKARNFR